MAAGDNAQQPGAAHRFKNLMVVFTDAAPGHDDEFNQWYGGEHIHQVMKIPGFAALQRFEVSDLPYDLRHAEPPARFLAIYEIEDDDPRDAMARLAEARRKGDLPPTEAMDPERTRAWFFRPISARLEST